MKITFSEPRNVTPPGLDGSIYEFPFLIEDGAGEVDRGTVESSISGTLMSMWGFNRSSRSECDSELAKVLFAYAYRAVIHAAARGELDDLVEVNLRTDTAPAQIPFKPDTLPQPAGTVADVSLENPKQTQGHLSGEAVTQVAVGAGGSVSLENLPFKEGELVEVVVRPVRDPVIQADRSPLRGSVVRYDDPFRNLFEAE